jgi:galactokinase
MDPVIYNRALHCVTEDIRTLSAVDALKEDDFTSLGEHMTQSHRSLQLHYEVLITSSSFALFSLTS